MLLTHALSQTATPSRTPCPSSATYFMDGSDGGYDDDNGEEEEVEEEEDDFDDPWPDEKPHRRSQFSGNK